VKGKRTLNHLAFYMAAFTRTWPVLVSAAILIALFHAAVSQADGPNQVGLVVMHGDGSVVTRCIEFSEDEISGYDVLDRSGLDLNIDPSGGIGLTVCRLDNEGCTFPPPPCFCQCAGGGASCIYWSYWHLVGDDWQYSGAGASIYQVSDGDVEGWVWGLGTAGEASPPPVIPFEEICTLPTSTPTATASPTREPTSTPTNTPEPTNTPKPPIIAHFSADRTTINAGESVTLSWDLSGAKAAYLRHEGAEEGVVAPGSKTVSPATTTVYTLIARNDGGETTAEVTITVIPLTDTPLATDATPATDIPAATEAPPPSTTPSPTSLPSTEPGGTPTPEQPSVLPTDTPLPPPPAEVTSNAPPLQSTSLPAVTPSATSTPASVAVVNPTSSLQKRATPPTLLRDMPQESGSDIPVVVLGVVGVIALLGGMVGLVIILGAARRM
jgi:hypothetical protein